MIQEATTLPNLRILIGCREFDRQNDPRIRRLTEGNSLTSGSPASTSSITVTPLEEADVREIVNQLGIDATSLSDEQTDLLSIALHLRLFREIVELGDDREEESYFGFESLKELYDRYWNEKRRAIELL